MARPLATLAAFVLSVIGVNMFGSNYDPASGCSELWASFIVKLGMYFLLLDVNLYQKNFKKLHHVPLFFYEMVTASFFIETVVHYIWMPIEKYLVQNVPKLVKCLCMNLVRRTISGQVFELIIKFTFSQSMMTFYCYMLSIMFVLCVLHATRSLDFRLIRNCGVGYFIRDSTMRLQEGVQKMYLPRCRIKELRERRKRNCSGRSRRRTR